MNQQKSTTNTQVEQKPIIHTVGSKILDLSYWQLGCAFATAWLAFTVGMSLFVDDHMVTNPHALAFTDWMSQYIPMLSSIQKIPGASQWVRFFYAVMWAVVPFFMIFGWLMRRQMCIKRIYLIPISDMRVVVSILGLALMISILLWWPVNDGRGWRDQAAISRGFGVAHFAFCAFVCSSGMGLYLRLAFSRIKFGNFDEINLEGN